MLLTQNINFGSGKGSDPLPFQKGSFLLRKKDRMKVSVSVGRGSEPVEKMKTGRKKKVPGPLKVLLPYVNCGYMKLSMK